MKFTVDGHEAYAYTGGKPFDAALPCVVFIHGALNDHSVWTLLARWCAHHGFGVLAVDLPGHGRSGGEPLQSVEDIAAWLHRLLDAAGVAKAALVGHSMGSLIALEAAERASALVMVGTAYPMKVSDALLTTARDQPEAAMAMVNAFSHSLASAKPGYPGPGAWLRGGWHVAVGYCLGFAVLLLVLGWAPDEAIHRIPKAGPPLTGAPVPTPSKP